MTRLGFMVLSLLLACLVLLSAGRSEETKPMALLWQTAALQPGQTPLPNKKPWVIREREIVFDPLALTMIKDAASRPHKPLAVELFDGRAHEIDIVSTITRLSDLSTIKGTFKQTSRATWSLVVSGQLVNGTFQVGDRLYKVEHVQNGRHRLLEVDPLKLPPE